jgi:hypothetical protein
VVDIATVIQGGRGFHVPWKQIGDHAGKYVHGWVPSIKFKDPNSISGRQLSTIFAKIKEGQDVDKVEDLAIKFTAQIAGIRKATLCDADR